MKVGDFWLSVVLVVVLPLALVVGGGWVVAREMSLWVGWWASLIIVIGLPVLAFALLLAASATWRSN